LIEEYEGRINKSLKIAEIAKGLGNNTTNVEQLVAEATSTHLEILSEVHENVPEQAKQAIEKAMGVSSNGREKAVEALKEKDALGGIPEELPIPEEVKEKMPSIAKEKTPATIPEEEPEEIEVETPEAPEQTEQPETPSAPTTDSGSSGSSAGSDVSSERGRP